MATEAGNSPPPRAVPPRSSRGGSAKQAVVNGSRFNRIDRACNNRLLLLPKLVPVKGRPILSWSGACLVTGE